jgi:predicted nucleic acid-binding protein
MSVLVDSTIWSLAFRRPTATAPQALELGKLARNGQAKILGVIRQEVLSGIQNIERFTYIRNMLRAFKDLPLTTQHYELAADYYNVCRSRGVQGSHADFLICAVSNLERLRIFSTDSDFLHYARYLPIAIHQP